MIAAAATSAADAAFFILQLLQERGQEIAASASSAFLAVRRHTGCSAGCGRGSCISVRSCTTADAIRAAHCFVRTRKQKKV
jgi:hypothetical protein